MRLINCLYLNVRVQTALNVCLFYQRCTSLPYGKHKICVHVYLFIRKLFSRTKPITELTAAVIEKNSSRIISKREIASQTRYYKYCDVNEQSSRDDICDPTLRYTKRSCRVKINTFSVLFEIHVGRCF